MKHLSIQIAYREDLGDWNVNVQRETRTPCSGKSYSFPGSHEASRTAKNMDIIIGAAIDEIISTVEDHYASHQRNNDHA